LVVTGSSEPSSKALLDRAFGQRKESFPDDILFSVPSFKHFRSAELASSGPPRFAALSITGRACELGCEHCKGSLLHSMIPTERPEDLVATARRLATRGVQGILVSGGCDREGRVPLEPFLEALERANRELGLRVAVHAGLVDAEGARRLASAGVDRALLDIVGDRRTAREVLHIDAGPERFEASLVALCDAGVSTVPHIVVGLHFGEILGEQTALEIAARNPAAALALVVLRPEAAAPHGSSGGPSTDEVGLVLAAARLALPDRPILLGCARPVGARGREIERVALAAGVNGIAFPSDATVRMARELGLRPRLQDLCCAFA
jgi:hypothetical protein